MEFRLVKELISVIKIKSEVVDSASTGIDSQRRHGIDFGMR